jgi:hypothetical protein
MGVTIIPNMSSNIESLPIYIQLVETPSKTPRLVEEIIQLSERFNLYESVTLASYTERGTDNGEDILVYRIDAKPQSRQDEGSNVINFLDHIFRKMFDKFPSFVEPVKDSYED